MKKLTRSRVNWIICQIGEWYAIREQSGLDKYPTRADVDHSALLRRLLSGEKALRYPPPRSFSYPNYHAAEGNEFIPMNVWFTGKSSYSPLADIKDILAGDMVPGAAIIDQASWDVVGREGDTFFIKWKTDPATWTLKLNAVITTTAINRDSHQWVLQRIDE